MRRLKSQKDKVIVIASKAKQSVNQRITLSFLLLLTLRSNFIATLID